MESFISQRIKGEIGFQEMNLSFFPYPFVEVNRVHVAIPGTLEGTIGSVRVYPALRPLLKGEIRFEKFQIEAPNLTLSLPEERPGEGSGLFTLRAVQEKIGSLVSVLESKIPGLRVEITMGNLELSKAGQTVLLFQDIHGQFTLPPEALQITGADGS